MPEMLDAPCSTSDFGTRTLTARGLRLYVHSDTLSYDAMLTEQQKQVRCQWAVAPDEDRMVDTGETVDVSPWLMDMLPDIEELGDLQDNWDSYGSPPPSGELIANVVLLLHRAERLLGCVEWPSMPRPDVVPLPGGGVQLEWHLPQKELELEFSEGDPPSALKVDIESGEEVESTFGLDDDEAVGSLLAWLVSR